MKKHFTSLMLSIFFILISSSMQSQEAYMGVNYSSVHEKKASKLNFEKPFGAYLRNIIPNSPADKIQLKPFDYIYKIGNFNFTDDQHLGDILDNFSAGDESVIYFVRGGGKMEQMITFGEEQNDQSQHLSAEQDPFLGIASTHSKVPGNLVGIPVNITKHSAAEKMGLEDGDIISHINDYPIYDMHDAGAAIDMAAIGEQVEVKYVRNKNEREAIGTMQSLAETRAAKHTIEPAEDLLGEIEDVNITMEDMPLEEAEEMKKERGIDMPIIQNLEIEQLKIFPNPNQGLFNLQFTLLKKAPTVIRIFNSNGQLVFANDYKSLKGDYSEQIDLSNSPAGAYYLMIQQKKNSVTKKVIIVRD